MATYTLIHFESNDNNDDRVALMGVYDTLYTASQVMKALYNHTLSSVGDWDCEFCACEGVDAVVLGGHQIHRWFIFNSDDAGIHYSF